MISGVGARPSHMRFVRHVVELASDISIVTKCRLLLEAEPDTFSLCMNQWTARLLDDEVNERWTAVIWGGRWPRDERSVEFFMGKPITIIDELPDGLVIGGL